jgi:hypothetical protein
VSGAQRRERRMHACMKFRPRSLQLAREAAPPDANSDVNTAAPHPSRKAQLLSSHIRTHSADDAIILQRGAAVLSSGRHHHG